MATLVTFRIARLDPGRDPRRARGADLRDRPDDPAVDALRISVGFFTTDEEIERFAAAVELLAAHTPATLPAPRLTILGDRPWGTAMSERADGRPPPRCPARPSPILGARSAGGSSGTRPRPVVRAVLSSLVVAIVLGLGYLVYDTALRRGADLPGGDLRTLYLAIDVRAIVLVVGSVVTWLVVPQPRGPGTATTPDGWSAALGFFAAVPVCYLVLVVVVQILEPLIG